MIDSKKKLLKPIFFITAGIPKLRFVIVLAMLLALAGFFILQPRIIEFTLKRTPLAEPEKPITLLFTGDIMLDRGVKYMVEKHGDNDFSFPFAKIADEIKNADLAMANLESQISNKGSKVGSIYSFRAPIEAMQGLTFSGIDIVSLANNHALDYGSQALKDSLERLIDAGISPVGVGNEYQAFSPAIKTVNSERDARYIDTRYNTRFAFFAYTDQMPVSSQAKGKSFGIAVINKDNLTKIKADIELAKQLADIFIVSFHWGTEYAKEPGLEQVDLARDMIDVGADLIIGHHPHVVQKYEKYKDGYIFYSLGNFIFDQGFSNETLEGEIAKIIIKDKKIIDAFPLRIIMNEFFQPELEK